MLIAGQPSEARAALIYDISLGAGAQIDDNFHLDPRTAVEERAEGEAALRQPVKETIFIVSPGLTAMWLGERDRLQLLYNGAYSMFQGDEERDSFWTHAVTADLSWRRWSPFFLEAREERSRVPRSQEREGEAWVDQVDRNLLSVRTGLEAELGARSTFELAYRGELESYSASGAAAPVAEETDSAADVIEELDRLERHYGEALLRHRWSPLWGSELRAAYGKVGRDLAPDYTELRASLAVEQRWSEHLSLRYRLEWRREEDGEPATGAGTAVEGTAADGTVAGGAAAVPPVAGIRSNLLGGAEIRGILERGGSWNLGYQLGQQVQPDGDTLETGRASAAVSIRARLGSTLDLGGWHETRDFRESGREETAWGPTVGARWLLTPWSAFDLAGSWTSTSIREEALAEVEDRTTRVAAGLVLLLVKRVQLDLGYGYRKNDSTDALRAYANNLYFAQLTFHFKPVEAGRIPASYASRLVVGGVPSGGAAQAGDAGGAAEPAR